MSIFAKRFNVKCEPRKPWFYRVLVFKTTALLREYLRHYAISTKKDPKRYKNSAGCCAWTGPLPITKNCVGWIAMSIEETAYVSIASHDLCRAAMFYWCNMLGMSMGDLDGSGEYGGGNATENEERFCRISQELSRTFWLGWQRKPRRK